MKKGFTLIELLVVVLIIGILAAIALPQYQTAVMKSRFATMIPVVKGLSDAQEVYYMENGQYAASFDDLSVSLPSGCVSTQGVGSRFKCGKICYEISTEGTKVFADTGGVLTYIVFGKNSSSLGRRVCSVTNNHSQANIAHKVCKSMTNKSPVVNGNYTNYEL